MSQTLTLDTLLAAARKASRALAGADRDAGLRAMAAGLERDAERVLAANAEDVRAARAGGMPAPQLDRLTLAPERLRAIAAACEEVAALPDPLGRVQGGWTLAAGPRVTRVTFPFGVIAMSVSCGMM